MTTPYNAPPAKAFSMTLGEALSSAAEMLGAKSSTFRASVIRDGLPLGDSTRRWNAGTFKMESYMNLAIAILTGFAYLQ